MTPFEAKNEKKYAGYGDYKISATQKLAQMINSTAWNYSWHWPDNVDESWKDAVTEDLNSEVRAAKERLAELETARKILNEIEFEGER